MQGVPLDWFFKQVNLGTIWKLDWNEEKLGKLEGCRLGEGIRSGKETKGLVQEIL